MFFFIFISLVSSVFENNWVTSLTAQEMQYSTEVYDVTLNTNTANFVCELIDKAPVHIL